MKKLVLVLLVLAAIGAMAFAEPSYDRDDGSYDSDSSNEATTPSQSTPKDSEPAPQSSSQNSFVAWPPAIADDMVLINFGIGLGYSSWGYKIGLPPIRLSADFELPIPIPITVGGMVGIRTWTYSWYSWLFRDDFTIFEIPIGVRGMYHFNFAAFTDNSFVRKLDAYAGLTMGWVIVFDNYKGDSYYWSGRDSYFLWGVNAGARYFFNDVIGLYLEVGVSGFDYASFGLTLKF
jgi:hypothetical protein